jgi:hypothetical protein
VIFPAQAHHFLHIWLTLRRTFDETQGQNLRWENESCAWSRHTQPDTTALITSFASAVKDVAAWSRERAHCHRTEDHATENKLRSPRKSRKVRELARKRSQLATQFFTLRFVLKPTVNQILPRSWVGYPRRRPKGCGMQSTSGPKVYPKQCTLAQSANNPRQAPQTCSCLVSFHGAR